MSEVYTEAIDTAEIGAIQRHNHIMSEVFTEPTNEKSDEEAGSFHCQPHLLDKHTDPFATREGKTLLWRGVNMTLVSISMPDVPTSYYH